MISEFVRERRRYTKRDLCDIFHCKEEKTVSLIRKLREYGILKAVSASALRKDVSDLIDDDIEVADIETGEQNYVFTFVGVIIIDGKVLKCYPKYLPDNAHPKDELRQILKVLEKYNSNRQNVRMFEESTDNDSFNLLSTLLFLLNDYYENGVYSNTEDIVEINGSGEILWDKTINETIPLLSGNRPYYVNLLTKKRVNDEYDYIRRLHECILTKASKELQDADLLDLFEIAGVDLSDDDISDFGENDYILYRIEKELSVQFNTGKQTVLKTLYSYISGSGNLSDTDALSVFGTNKFELVWEKVCADIMDNQLNTVLGSLSLPVPLKKEYDKRQKLIDIIEKPLWSVTGNTAEDTFIPDLISIQGDRFIIFDAKYYTPVLEPGKPPKSQPGIESVAKQYLYQLAYQKFIEDHGFTEVKNCFLLPTKENNVTDKGTASMNILGNLGLENIRVKLLPASKAYSYYLSGRKMDISELEL